MKMEIEEEMEKEEMEEEMEKEEMEEKMEKEEKEDKGLRDTTSDGNMTTSMLTISPTPSDDGTTMTCRAENLATNTVLEQSLPITVNYVPEAFVSLGSNLDPRNIKEGDDVYFECSIQANPRSYKVVWKHNGRELQHNISGGIIVSNQSLVLQRVTRKHAGRYTCTASNIEGDGTAEPVTLDIKYAPVCAPGQIITYGVARNEDAEVTCRVAANPPAEDFKWTFNNTADTIDVPPGRFTSTPTYSIITYTPMTELDYGTLLCWAENAIGQQSLPCVFHIVPAGKPDPSGQLFRHQPDFKLFHSRLSEGLRRRAAPSFLPEGGAAGTQGHTLTGAKPEFQVMPLIESIGEGASGDRNLNVRIMVGKKNENQTKGLVKGHAFDKKYWRGRIRLPAGRNVDGIRCVVKGPFKILSRRVRCYTTGHFGIFVPRYALTVIGRDCSRTVLVARFSARQVIVVPSSEGVGDIVNMDVVMLPSLVVCKTDVKFVFVASQVTSFFRSARVNGPSVSVFCTEKFGCFLDPFKILFLGGCRSMFLETRIGLLVGGPWRNVLEITKGLEWAGASSTILGESSGSSSIWSSIRRPFWYHSTWGRGQPVVAEVREGSSSEGSSSTAGGILNENSSSDFSLISSEVGGVPALVSIGAGAGVLILLIFLVAVLLRHRLRRPTIPQPNHPPAHSVLQSSPQPILKNVHDISHTCAEREMQVESESEVEPDLIPTTLAQSGLTPSGPLLMPPPNYGGAEAHFVDTQIRGGPASSSTSAVVVGVGVAGGGSGGGVGSGGGGGVAGVGVAMAGHPPSSSFQQQQHLSSVMTSTPHHEQHLLTKHHYQHDIANDPRYAHLDLDEGGQHQVMLPTPKSRLVPTVYATLDTRHAHSRVTFDLRQAQSQVSIGHDLGYPQRGGGMGQGGHNPCDLGYGQHIVHTHGHDLSRSLLEEDPTPETPLVGKRESSV
ncbi:uncharacterized protein [Palaemon carinicauda]|uniref:uncharacterized protein n=1 Tax=Palaemon carinicauda TaxID=392227 RepID=UPI0035B5D1FC